MKIFLNDTNEYIGYSKSANTTLAEAQIADTTITQEIPNAPTGLNLKSPTNPTFSKRVAGDGSSLSDYIEVVNPTELNNQKMVRRAAIDTRTVELIQEGFVYDNVTLSLSPIAQTNWIGLRQADSLGLITFPFEVSTLDDNKYSIVDAASLALLYGTELNVKIGHLNTGRALKSSITAAIDQATLDAIVDIR